MSCLSIAYIKLEVVDILERPTCSFKWWTIDYSNTWFVKRVYLNGITILHSEKLIFIVNTIFFVVIVTGSNNMILLKGGGGGNCHTDRGFTTNKLRI